MRGRKGRGSWVINLRNYDNVLLQKQRLAIKSTGHSQGGDGARVLVRSTLQAMWKHDPTSQDAVESLSTHAVIGHVVIDLRMDCRDP